jgi:hypothetical protein
MIVTYATYVRHYPITMECVANTMIDANHEARAEGVYCVQFDDRYVFPFCLYFEMFNECIRL